jgi:hypothetical protein
MKNRRSRVYTTNNVRPRQSVTLRKGFSLNGPLKEKKNMTFIERKIAEMLKNEIAITADGPTTGLVVPQPGDMIYVEPAKPRPHPSPEPSAVIELDPVPVSTVKRPLGY